jgi:hypothetical protein
MTGYETFSLYQAIKLHFSQESYDFFKYNGKSNVSLNAFDSRKDKYHFHKLSRRYQDKDDMINFIVSNFVENEKTWVGSLLQDEAEVNYLKHQKIIQSLSYMFENDCKNVFEGEDDPNSLLKTEGDYPILLKKALRKEIHIESVCLLNNILNFVPVWTKKINDTIHWPNYRIKVLKYSAFLPKETMKYKLILKKVIDK